MYDIRYCGDHLAIKEYFDVKDDYPFWIVKKDYPFFEHSKRQPSTVSLHGAVSCCICYIAL